MSYTVKLAIFPPWKEPLPYETLTELFKTVSDALVAGKRFLDPVTESDLAAIAHKLEPESRSVGTGSVTSIAVPANDVHGFLIYDAAGIEVFNWTSLDEAVERAGKNGN